jgi:exosortase/archaeosortase family protein
MEVQDVSNIILHSYESAMSTEFTIPRSSEYPIRSGIYRTAGIFIVCTAILWTLINISWMITYLIDPLSLSLAWFASILLQIFGQSVHQAGLFINSPLINLEVTPACTGIYQIVVLIGGLVAWSTTGRERNRGIVIGIIALMSINIIRLVSIYYCALSIPDWVPFFHGVFWEGVMVLFVPLFWMFWVNRTA